MEDSLMRIFCLFFLFFLSIPQLNSQILTVVDKESRTPVSGAILYTEKPKIVRVTNSNGEVDIWQFKGAQRIVVQSFGYKPIVVDYDSLVKNELLLELEPSRIHLGSVLVSGNRWEQEITQVPARVVEVPRAEIVFQNPQTTADLLGRTGLVFIQKSQQAGGSPMIRGFAANRLLYSVDGVRMNSAIFRSGNLQNVINIDPFTLEETEVILGPGSVLYGSDAIGGVMSFKTVSPQFTLKQEPYISGSATARYSTANMERTGHFDINIGFRKWAFLTSISSWDFGHLRQGAHGPEEYIKEFSPQRQDSTDVVIYHDDPLVQIPTQYSQMNILQKIRYQPTDKWDFLLSLQFSETSPYGRYDRHNRLRNGKPQYAEWNYGPQRWLLWSLQIRRQDPDVLWDNLTTQIALQEFGESRITRNFNDPERQIREEQVWAYSLNIDATKGISDRFTLFYGTEFVQNTVNSNGVIENIRTGQHQKGPSRYPQADWGSYAAYLLAQYRLSSRAFFTTGGRYTFYTIDAIFDTTFYPFPFTSAQIQKGAINGSVGVVYLPDENLTTALNMTTGFRAPNVDDIGKVFDSEPGSVVVPNPSLEAEYAYSIDGRISYRIDDVLNCELSGFYTLLTNAMVRRDFQLNGEDTIIYDGVPSRVQAIQNAAQAWAIGGEMAVEIALPAGFSFLASFLYQDGEEEMDDGSSSPLRHVPPMWITARLQYAAKKLRFEFSLNYQGEKSYAELALSEREKREIYAVDAEGKPYVPAWYTLNCKFLYMLTASVVVSAGIENITDQRYRTYSSGISSPGRNFFLAVTTVF